MLVSGDRKKFFVCLEPGGELQTHRGILHHDELIGIPWGSEIRSHLDLRYHIVEPTLRDVLLHIKRRSQIVYPKDIGYILLRLSVGPGKTVIEAGTGSGGLTTALSWAVGPEGRVISYDRREDMIALARKNLQRVGLEKRVDFRLRDIAQGFDESGADALFLDLPTPHLYLPQVHTALTNGGIFGAILPTTNQVSVLIDALNRHFFGMVDLCEIILRFYKPIPERIRPLDRMVAHTGYLIFARTVLPEAGVETEMGEADFTNR
jgi:tRNA (adenine57-N1/adenine58-N1)-methyltransferase